MSNDAELERLDRGTAEEISAILTAIADSVAAESDGGHHWPAAKGGLLDVRFSEDHMTCHYDPAIADAAAWDLALRQRLGDRKADAVRYQPAATRPSELTALLEQVLRFDWHPRAATYGLAAWIDWQRELLVITTGAPASDEVAQTLVQLLGDRAVVTPGAAFPSRGGSGRAGRR